MNKAIRYLCLTFSTMVVSVTISSSSAAQGETEDDYRRYADGPLTAEDFESEVPENYENGRLSALTLTEIRYTYRYRVRRVRSRFSLALSELDVFAILLSERCWNKYPDNEELMDHEQGHFDITEIHARRAQREIDKLLEEDGVSVQGSSRRDAEQKLREWIDERLEPYLEKSKEENERYDHETLHGRRKAEQEQHRLEQKRLLEELSIEDSR